MRFSENEIKKYAEFAMSTLGLEVTPCPTKFDEILERPARAHIKISGKWQGIVSVVMERNLARQLAEKMFSLEKADASKEEINDAISEMTNMIGGNLKSLLPQPSQLSLPIVDTNDDLDFSFMKQVSQVVFKCLENKFKVAIYQIMETDSQHQPTHSETSTVQ